MKKRIVIDAYAQVSCPHCGDEFGLQEAIAQHLIEEYESEYDAMLKKERAELRETLAADAERSAARLYGEQLRSLQDQLRESRADKEKAEQQQKLAVAEAAEKAQEEAAERAIALKAELAAKDEHIAQYREAELALRKEKTLLEERQKDQALELQRQVEGERKRIEAQLAQEAGLREAEWRKKIDDAQKANEDLRRKLEQGSQQLQGEVLELHLEELLGTAFPFDLVEPVRKGAHGADVVHTVRLRSGVLCGKVVWETKRAGNWSNAWIDKLKDDQQSAGGELAVLVSTVFPAGVTDPMVIHNGIWLVRPELVRALAEALRTVLIESQRQRSISVGRDESLEALYNYVTSAAFAQKLRAVVNTYQQMREDLDKEKAAMARLWKKREAQIERASSNMLGLCGELQGVSENALPQLDDIGLLPS